jgi:hypothetical protein
MNMKLKTQVQWIMDAIQKIEKDKMQLYKKYLLAEDAEGDLKKNRVLFALIERNDATGVIMAEKNALFAKHFKWTPAEHILRRRKRKLVEKKEFYIATPIGEVIALLKKEFI